MFAMFAMFTTSNDIFFDAVTHHHYDGWSIALPVCVCDVVDIGIFVFFRDSVKLFHKTSKFIFQLNYDEVSIEFS